MQCCVWHCSCRHRAMHGVVGAVVALCGCCGWHCLATCDIVRAVVLPCLVLPWSLLRCVWCWGHCCRAVWVLRLLSLCRVGCRRCCRHAMCDVGGAIIALCGCCGCHCHAALGVMGAVVTLCGTGAWWALKGEGSHVHHQEGPGCKRGS